MKRSYLLLFFILYTIVITQAQSLLQDSSSIFRIVFYNIENLFDPTDDSLKNDDAFTPEGFNHWTYKKMRKKVNDIAKVLLAIGEREPPVIIGLAEIENLYVLKQLCYNSPLKKYRYHIVHYESPDMRGIDVAMLYRKEKFNLLHSEPISVIFPFEPQSKNRDILYAIGTFPNGDSLHLFINHWTSRYGGYAATIPKRNYYAQLIRNKADTLLQQNPQSYILITGDLNDYPTDESVSQVLQASELNNGEATLYNLMFRFLKMANMGTHKREDFWGCLDQMIVSKALVNKESSLQVKDHEAHIFNADFLLEPDEKYGGDKLFRTYLGPKYIGGYSDHLPIYLDIQLKKRR